MGLYTLPPSPNIPVLGDLGRDRGWGITLRRAPRDHTEHAEKKIPDLFDQLPHFLLSSSAFLAVSFIPVITCRILLALTSDNRVPPSICFT